MLNEILQLTELDMSSVIDSYKDFLIKIRTGRANANMLKGVMVDYYGTPTLIEQTAQISSPEPQQLIVKPYDRSQVATIIGAINKADLGLNPMSEADLVRIIIPPLTEEVRKDLVKKVHKELEQFKVRIRNARRDGNDSIKKSTLTDDEKKSAENDIQKLTDKHIARLDEMAKEKEKELMTI